MSSSKAPLQFEGQPKLSFANVKFGGRPAGRARRARGRGGALRLRYERAIGRAGAGDVAAGRVRRDSVSEADLRKYLARFGLTWDDIS